ncbi:MAG: DnaJ family domain-containing protein [Thermodesulfobacteriota bacterium]|nr:DnaJ family domain-containing protein [Thermodesulfobacteriota bacterium]
MLPGFEKIVEQRIKQARQEGAFDNLPGAGHPLKLSDDRHIPEDLRLSYKILKNADFLPPELELRKEIQQTEDLLAGVSDVHEQYRLNKKLNFLITKVNMIRNTRVETEMPQRYLGKLSERIGGKR